MKRLLALVLTAIGFGCTALAANKLYDHPTWDQMERAIAAAEGIPYVPHPSRKTDPTFDQMERLIKAIREGGGGGSVTNPVALEAFTYATNMLERAKREKDDLAVYRKVKDIWTWTSYYSNGWTQVAAPADFLEVANSPGTIPLAFKGGGGGQFDGGWFNASQFWPNGRVKYDAGEHFTGDLGSLSTNLYFAFTAYSEDGERLFQFGAKAHRESATDETLVDWFEKGPASTYPIRLVTTDLLNHGLEEKTGTNEFATAVATFTDETGRLEQEKVPWTVDSSGKRTAVSVGRKRTDSSQVGQNSLAVGYEAVASGFDAVAIGSEVMARGEDSIAIGNQSETTEDGGWSIAAGVLATASNTAVVVWNSNVNEHGDEPYGDHGPGTFNVKPAGGLSGFWIGESSLATFLDEKLDRDDVLQFEGTNRNAVMSQQAVTRFVEDSVTEATRDLLSREDPHVVDVSASDGGIMVSKVRDSGGAGPVIWTGRTFAEAVADTNSAQAVSNGWVVSEETGNEALTAKAFEHWCGDLSGSLVYLCNCYSGYDSTLADALLAKGARAVVTHTDLTKSAYGDAVLCTVMSRLSETNGAGVLYSVAEAVDYATSVYGHDDGVPYPVEGRRSRPKIYGDAGYRLSDSASLSVQAFQPYYFDSVFTYGDPAHGILLPDGIPNDAAWFEAALVKVTSLPNVSGDAYRFRRMTSVDARFIGRDEVGNMAAGSLVVFQGHGSYLPRGADDTGFIPLARGCARPLPPYLHYLELGSSYPDDAAWYYRYVDEPVSACSARRIGDSCERNFDWKYDEAPEFVLSIPAASNRFASLGVATVGTNLTERFVTSGAWSRFYKCLPGRTMDGINENGVFAEVNVVPTNGSPWEAVDEHGYDRDGKKRDINSLGAVRWVLDHATDAHMAATSLAERVYIAESTKQQGYSVHFAICDKEGTYIVEDGTTGRHKPEDVAVTTNYRVIPSAFDDVYGSGRQRAAILSNQDNPITNVWYMNVYRSPYAFLDEFAGEYWTNSVGDTVRLAWDPEDTEKTAFRDYVAHNIPEGIDPRAVPRTGMIWQTLHTAIYDIEECTLRIAVQENDDWYVFSGPKRAEAADLTPAIEYTTAVSNRLETGKLDVPDGTAVTNGHAAVFTVSDGTVRIADGGGLPQDYDSVSNAAMWASNEVRTIVVPVISETDPTFSNAVLAVGLGFSTNEVTSAAYIAATNALSQLGFDADALAELPGGRVYGSVGALLAALAAAVAWLKKNKADKGELPYMTRVGDGRYEYTGALVDAATRTYPREG